VLSFRGTIYLVGIALVLLGLGPVILSAVADAVAARAGCVVRTPVLGAETVEPCLIGGHDWGMLLHQMSLLRWSWVFALPVAAMGAAILALRIGIDIWERR
jgi:hypothetical protein